MQRTCFFFVCLLVSFSVMAQSDGSVRGVISDTSLHEPLSEATITIMNAADSSLVTFTRSDQKGNFIIRGLEEGKYRMLITHVGYVPFSLHFNISGLVKDIHLPVIPLTSKAKMLAEVTVTEEVAPVTIRKDTVEYNAGSFKTRPNAVVEDLLKKFPGIQVDKDGKIKANGEEVKNVLVDGKPFFGNDPKTATQNLPADIVDKVQVFDKKSEQSAFTGFDDGNSEKTMNLTLKKDKKNGLFGRATAGAGNRSRYEGKLNLNQFSGETQLSLIGMSNNINKQGFTFSDILDFSGGMNAMAGKGGMMAPGGLPIQGMSDKPGISATTAGGVNYNDTWSDQTDFNSSYFYNNISTTLEQRSLQQWQLPANPFHTERTTNNRQENINHRVNLTADHRMDSINSIRFTSAFNFQQSASSVFTNYLSVSGKGNLMNEGFADAASNGNGYDWSNSLLYRHKFPKKGRTLSGTLNLQLKDVNNKGSLFSENNFYQPDGQLRDADTLNQEYSQANDNNTLQGTFAYTEPLSRNALLEANYSLNINRQYSEKETFDYNRLTGKFSTLNESLTNAFNNLFAYHRGILSVRTQQKKYSATIGLAVQYALLENGFHLPQKDSSIKRNYTNLLPNANLQYDFNKYRNLRVFYNTTMRQPAIADLQPVADNTDPLNIRKGNPDLKQEYAHQVRMNYHSFDPFRRTSFLVMLTYRSRNNAIVYADEVTTSGSRISQPMNADGVYNLNGNISYGFYARWLKSDVNLNTSLTRSQNISYVNQAKNSISGFSFTQEVSVNFLHKEVIDLVASSAFSYNVAGYSLDKSRNNEYTTRTHSLEANIYLPEGFSIAGNLDYVNRKGLSSGYNNQPLILNAGIAKQFLKNKSAELRFQVFDMLNENVGISRNSNQNYVEDISYNVLNRYFLLSLTYNISRFAGKLVAPRKQPDVEVIRM